MDRDMVNCLHYLYHRGSIPLNELHDHVRSDRLLWCGPDTTQPLLGKILVQDVRTSNVGMAAGALELIKQVEDQLLTLPGPTYAFGYPIRAPLRLAGSPRPAFLAIAYAPEFTSVKAAVLTAAERAGFDCKVTGDISAPGNILDQVWQGVRSSDVVVADISGSNPNVFYEIGLAHALGKEVILITQEDAAPFDIQAARREKYDRSDLGALTTKLVAAFTAVPPRYPHEGEQGH